MEAEPKLDEKYTTGVYYDVTGGYFCKIREVDDTIGLFEHSEKVAGNIPYYTFDEDGLSKEEAIDIINTDMYRLPEDAVENPADYIQEMLDVLCGGRRRTNLSVKGEAGVNYARQQVEISEK